MWLATGLEPGTRTSGPTEQDLRCARFPIAEFDAMIRRGEVADAATRRRLAPVQPAMMPWPTTTSPRIRQATWPGAAPSTGSARWSASPSRSPTDTRQGIGTVR